MLLPDIPRGSTWSPDYMRDCLARWVAAQPPAPRRAFFETWERRHGHASAAALHAQAKAAFTAARGAHMSFNYFADEIAFREQTGRQSRMAGVTGPSFRCVECSRVCRTLGRKRTAAGWRCAGCNQARERRGAGKEAA